MLLLLQATQAADSVQVAADKLMKEAIANADGLDKLSLITQQLIDFGIPCRRTHTDCGPCLYCRTFPHLDAQPIYQASDGQAKGGCKHQDFREKSGKYSVDHPVNYFCCRCLGS